LKLALIVPAPFDAVSGGYEYDRRMVRGLRDAGHDLRVIELTGAHPVADDAARDAAAAALEDLGDARPIVDGLGLPAFAPVADALVARGAVGLIHHPTALESGLPEADRATLGAIERDLLPRLPRIVVTSRATAANLAAAFGVDPDRIAVVEPGTEPAPRARGSADGPCHVLAIGTLVPRKGHDVLIRALARLHDLSWRLTIVGSAERDTAHAEMLRALTGELNVMDRVTFAGEATGATLEALWDRADLFALATRWEGYGMAVAEALARGVPVAITSGGAVGDLVPPDAGVRTTVGDHDALSRAMRRLIYDPALRRAYADAAWRAGQTLPDWNAQAARFAEALA
jgi:glycosyltransferase involved in cell wall biosynthesis